MRTAIATGHPFPVYCQTTVGLLELEIHPAWAPWGVERFTKLIGDGYFTNTPFSRAIPDFLVQFGISLDEDKAKRWRERPSIPDDKEEDKPLTRGFKRGMISFAGSAENSRTTQLFIAFSDNDNLGKEPWESPIGLVIGDGMERLEKITM